MIFDFIMYNMDVGNHKIQGKCQEEFRQVKETALQRRRTEPAAGGTGDL